MSEPSRYGIAGAAITIMILMFLGFAAWESGVLSMWWPETFKPVPPKKIELYTHSIPGGTCLIARTHDGQVAVGCVGGK